MGKKSSEKSAKNVFLYSHEYRDQNIGGTKRAKQFFQQDTNSASKYVGKKSSKKSAKNVFYIHTNIVTKKWVGKNARNNFSETQELCDQ